MGSHGGSAPNPYKERHVTTRFLHVPVGDWPAVKIGRKREFRAPIKHNSPIFPYTPTPVVAYTRRGTTYDKRMMVLSNVRRETLWQIKEQPESLEAEGFDTYEEFRAYWKARTRKYLPLTMVYVYEIKPFDTRLDGDTVGRRLIEHLYGEFM